jgi:hypothetical protein
MAKNKPSVEDIIAGVQQVIKSPESGALRQFIEETLKKAGGAKSLATALYDMFEDETTPVSVRGRIIDFWLKTMIVTHEKTPRKIDAGDITEEDIERELRRIFNAADILKALRRCVQICDDETVEVSVRLQQIKTYCKQAIASTNGN